MSIGIARREALILSVYRRERGPIGEKVVFSSPHCLVDFGNGAAIATAQILRFLQGEGFFCRAFCGAWLDIPEETAIEDILARRGMTISNGPAGINEHTLRLLRTSPYGAPLTIFGSVSTRG